MGPIAEHLCHYPLNVVEILLRLERVINAVVSLLVKLGIGYVGVVAEMRAARSLNQSVRHERTGGNDGVHNAPLDQVGDDQSLLGNGHRAGKGHDHKAILVAGHGFENVSSLTDLAPSEGSLRHCNHQIVNGAHVGEIQRLERNQLVFNRVV